LNALAPERKSWRIAAVVLAAGQSRRMAGTNKLLVEVAGAPIVVRVVDATLNSRADPVIVVTGFEAAALAAALGDRPVILVHNTDFASGLSSSLRCGIEAVPDSVDGVLVCLGDMPRLTAAHLDRLIDAFDADVGRAICVPVHNGQRGNPVLWARRYFGEILALRGDVGARRLLEAHADGVFRVSMDDDAVLADVDEPEDLRGLTAAFPD